MSVFIGIGIIIFLSLYFLPTIIAFIRKKENKISILVLNFFLGWTLIGWVLSLVWALAVDKTPQTITVINSNQQ